MTAMQIAWQEALDKVNLKERQEKPKQVKSGNSDEQEELLHRTLEKRLPTGN